MMAFNFGRHLKRIAIVLPLFAVSFPMVMSESIVVRAIGTMFLLAAFLTNFIFWALAAHEYATKAQQERELSKSVKPPEAN